MCVAPIPLQMFLLIFSCLFPIRILISTTCVCAPVSLALSLALSLLSLSFCPSVFAYDYRFAYIKLCMSM